jgi:hypothetical protein
MAKGCESLNPGPNSHAVARALGQRQMDVKPVEVNQAHIAASSIAGFHLAQLAFCSLVKSEIVSKAEAERLLKLAIEANKTGGPVNREAAELLVACLDNLSKFQAATRQ